MQLKVTTTIAGEDYVNTITAPAAPPIAGPQPPEEIAAQVAANRAAQTNNSAIIVAVTSAINLATGNKIDRIEVEVLD